MDIQEQGVSQNGKKLINTQHSLNKSKSNVRKCLACNGRSKTNQYKIEKGQTIINEVDCDVCNGTGQIVQHSLKKWYYLIMITFLLFTLFSLMFSWDTFGRDVTLLLLLTFLFSLTFIYVVGTSPSPSPSLATQHISEHEDMKGLKGIAILFELGVRMLCYASILPLVMLAFFVLAYLVVNAGP